MNCFAAPDAPVGVADDADGDHSHDGYDCQHPSRFVDFLNFVAVGVDGVVVADGELGGGDFHHLHTSDYRHDWLSCCYSCHCCYILGNHRKTAPYFRHYLNTWQIPMDRLRNRGRTN